MLLNAIDADPVSNLQIWITSMIRMTMVISESSCVWYLTHFIDRYTLKCNEYFFEKL